MHIEFDLEPNQAAGLLRFADKVSFEEALAVLYPHVEKETRDEQASQIISAFAKLEKALLEADVRSFPWIETGRTR